VSVALLEYFTSETRTLVLLAKDGMDRPLIAECHRPDAPDIPLTEADLLACVVRLSVDFRGLAAGWESGRHADRIAAALQLPPAVPAAKRTQPVRAMTLENPRFRYGPDYVERLSPCLLPAGIREAVENADLLCIVPHGPLHLFPFGALKWSRDVRRVHGASPEGLRPAHRPAR
jgi:hypothetical protein